MNRQVSENAADIITYSAIRAEHLLLETNEIQFLNFLVYSIKITTHSILKISSGGFVLSSRLELKNKEIYK